VAGAGDADGDGHDDTIIGAPEWNWGLAGADMAGDASAAYVVLGPATGAVDLATSAAAFLGEATGDFAGASVANAGDVDGDGMMELLVVADYEGPWDAGAAYVLSPATWGGSPK
jgi:hypothetical protein